MSFTHVKNKVNKSKKLDPFIWFKKKWKCFFQLKAKPKWGKSMCEDFDLCSNSTGANRQLSLLNVFSNWLLMNSTSLSYQNLYLNCVSDVKEEKRFLWQFFFKAAKYIRGLKHLFQIAMSYSWNFIGNVVSLLFI